MRDRIYTVGHLLHEVNRLLEQGFSGLSVQGEVTGVKRSARGHLYFCLKDDEAQLDCAMWASAARRLRFDLEDGLAVLALGSLTIYAQRGRFQMIVDGLEPQGIGALQLAFEQLKGRLDAEGLFAADRKRPLPRLSQRVGLVTSPTGAALRDMLAVLARIPHLEVILAPTRVQGEGAAEEIAAALTRLSGSGLVDLVIVGRGGGSLEDLWAFNEEPVARAIAAAPVPVVSAVGHETDVTIADFVADERAATPTRAAELVAARFDDVQRRLAEARGGLRRDMRRLLALSVSLLNGLQGSSGLARVPRMVELLRRRYELVARPDRALVHRVERARARLERAVDALERIPGRVAAGGHRRLIDSRREQMRQLVRASIARHRARLDGSVRALDHLGPRRVLERGYSITVRASSSTPLRDPAEVRAGDELVTTLARGTVRSVAAGDASVRRRRSERSMAVDQRSLFEEGSDGGS